MPTLASDRACREEDPTKLTIWLERVGPNGHWRIVGHKFTGPHGRVVFIEHFTTKFTVQLVFPGTKNFAKSTSAVVTVS